MESTTEAHPALGQNHSQPVPVPCEQMYRIQDVAKRLGMSVDWTLAHLKAAGAVISIPSPAKRGRRKYHTHLIPESALLRELRRLKIAC
jgi:hypothetical protein